MRILFTTFPWRSHHFPMVPLEWACQLAGHDVRVASTPSLVETIVDSGLPAVPVGEDVNLPRLSTDSSRASWHLQQQWPDDWPVRPEVLGDAQHELIANLGRMQVSMAWAMLDDLIGYARDWQPDLVVHDAVTLAGPVTAAAVGVPSVSHLWGTPGLQRIEMQQMGSEPLPEYADLYRHAGAPLRAEPVAWVDPCSPATRYPAAANVLTMRYIPYNGPGVLPDWLLEPPSRPRVCVCWGGTTAALLGPSVAEVVRQPVEAAAALGAEVVVPATADLAHALSQAPLPAGTRVEVDLPLHLLLPSCSAVVHHGGAGTSMTAACYGLPQLVVSRRPEPALNGQRLAAAGAALHLPASEVPAGEAGAALFTERLRVLLGEPSFRDAAARVREGIEAQPAPADVVAALERLA